MSRVSYAMMNPGGAAQMTAAVRGALSALAAEVARAAGIARERYPGDDPRRQPDHASPGAGDGSGGARRRAICARGRSGDHRARGRARHRAASERAHLLAAVHRRPRRCRRRRHDPRGAAGPGRGADAAGGCRHQRGDRARQPRAPARLLEPDRPGVRRRADQLRTARGARARSSACASIAATLEPRFKVIGCELWSDEPGFARGGRHASASPASAARASSR